jgi:hypothetical protein
MTGRNKENSKGGEIPNKSVWQSNHFNIGHNFVGHTVHYTIYTVPKAMDNFIFNNEV